MRPCVTVGLLVRTSALVVVTVPSVGKADGAERDRQRTRRGVLQDSGRVC